MKKEINKLNLKDFASLFGTETSDIPKDCRALISKNNFAYRCLSASERDSLLLEIIKKTIFEDLQVAGKNGSAYWQKVWSEILNNFIKANYDSRELVPRYLRVARFARLNSNYVVPKDINFWRNWFDIYRRWLFKKYLSKFDNIYEFGCGTGQNLILLGKIFPDKRLYGYDWSKSAIKAINLLSKKNGYNIGGRVFDMFSPDKSLNISPNSAIITVHSLEQMGNDYERFLNFIINKRPGLCINIEPIYELYDERNLVDYLAIKFHQKRKYLHGYFNRLKQLDKEGVIKIIKFKRVNFGSLYHDSYSYIIWKPVNKTLKND